MRTLCEGMINSRSSQISVAGMPDSSPPAESQCRGVSWACSTSLNALSEPGMLQAVLTNVTFNQVMQSTGPHLGCPGDCA